MKTTKHTKKIKKPVSKKKTPPKILQPGQRKKLMMLVFIFLFAAIGLYLLLRSFAAVPTTNRIGTPTIHVWDAAFQDFGSGHNPTITVPNLARNFDLVVSVNAFNRETVDKSKGVTPSPSYPNPNPNLKYIIYLNGCCNVNTELSYHRFTAADGPDFENAYAHDAAGRRLVSGAGVPLMNRRSTMWNNYRKDLCQRVLTQNHYDGCFFDSYSLDWFATAFVDNAPNSDEPVASRKGARTTPIDPLTNRPWTQENYDQVGQNFLVFVKANTHKADGTPAEIAINGLGTGSDFVGERDRLLANTDYAMAEEWIIRKDTRLDEYQNEVEWKKDIDMAKAVGEAGKHFIPTVKSWVSGSDAQKQQLLKFVTASFLLGADPNTALLNFQNEHSKNGGKQYYDIWNADIGSPSGEYFKSGGCYVRNYTKGKVVVNPGTTSCTYSLGSGYKTLANVAVDTVTLPAHTGEIYKGNPVVLVTTDDTVLTGSNRFTYSGSNWNASTDNSGNYSSTAHFNKGLNTTDSVTFTFVGTQLMLYGKRDPSQGKAAVSIDGGPETFIDMYAGTAKYQELLHPPITLSSPTRSDGSPHTLKVRPLNTKNENSSGYAIHIDYVKTR